MSYKVILCDIEGTTTSISFVKDNLFPYAAKNVNSFLEAKWDDEDTREAVKMLRDQFAADKADNVDGCVEIVAATEDKAKQIESIVANVQWQMEHDRKAGPLKNLQGLMWVDAYKAGAFKGQVYSDVAPAFEKWTKAGRKVYIYSSGSAAIQKVHFEHSEAGDLAKFLSGYFDTKVGAKQEKSSYEAILKEISKDDEALNAAEVLFLTDIPAEAKAAKLAGMEALLLKRPGNAELTEEETTTYKVVESFADIVVGNEDQVAAKRKLEEEAKEDVAKPAKVAKIEEKEQPVVEDTEMKSTEETDKEAVVEKGDQEKTATVTKTEETGNGKGSEETPAVVKEKEDVPMEEDKSNDDSKTSEEQATPAAVAESSTATEKTDKTEEKEGEKDETKTVEPEEEEKPEAKTDQEEDKMEVDSTTATTTTETKVKVEQEPVKEEEKVTPETETKSKESVDEVKPQTETEKPTETDTKEKDPTEDKKEVTAEQDPKDKENEEEQKVSASSEVSNVTDDTKATSIDEDKTTNGESETAVINGNGTAKATDEAEAVPTNGHQDNDSDKENDKSMEAKAEEVSTTQEVTEAEEVPKKCASLETVAVAPVAEVEAES